MNKDLADKLKDSRIIFLYLLMALLTISFFAELFSRLGLFGTKEGYVTSYWILSSIMVLLGITIPFVKNQKPCVHPERTVCLVDEIAAVKILEMGSKKDEDNSEKS